MKGTRPCPSHATSSRRHVRDRCVRHGQRSAATSGKADDKSIARGRYIAQIAGCNDCHTAGYAPSGGKVPEKQWLQGDALGLEGRLGHDVRRQPPHVHAGHDRRAVGEDGADMKARPPMPWFALNDMHDEDLRAFYRFVRHLGRGRRSRARIRAAGRRRRTVRTRNFLLPPNDRRQAPARKTARTRGAARAARARDPKRRQRGTHAAQYASAGAPSP